MKAIAAFSHDNVALIKQVKANMSNMVCWDKRDKGT